MQHCEQRRDTDAAAHQDNGPRTSCERERSSRRARLQEVSGSNMLMQESTPGSALILDGNRICPGGSGPTERIVSGDRWRVQVRSDPDDDVLSWKWDRQARAIEGRELEGSDVDTFLTLGNKL